MANSTSFPVFEANKVLTAERLNNIIRYFDQEIRLDRTLLEGRGIACGLEVSFSQLDPDNDGNAHGVITITDGFGLTSAGDLVQVKNCPQLVRYRECPLSKAAFLRDCTNESLDETIITYELLPDDRQSPPNLPSSETDLLYQNKVLVLLWIKIEEETQGCISNCDDEGTTCSFHLKKLLVDREEYPELFNCKYDPRADPKLDPNPYIRRLGHKLVDDMMPDDGFVVDLGKISTKSTFWENYREVAGQDGFNDLTQIIQQLIEAYQCALAKYAPIIGRDAPDPTFNQKLIKLQGKINQMGYRNMPMANTELRYFQIQYFYDHYKDLIAAYQEFIDVACEVVESLDACPDTCDFPAYLTLGSFDGVDLSCRNFFQRSCRPGCDQNKLHEAQLLFDRMCKLLEYFIDYLDTTENLNIQPTDGRTVDEEMETIPIRVTPSKNRDLPLSQKAIPYYYGSGNLAELRHCWNHKLRKRNHHHRIPSYYLQYGDSLPENQRLLYSIDGNDFFRIEGHIGQQVGYAFNEINKLRKDYNLPFDIKCIKLDGPPETVVLHEDFFDADLELQYCLAIEEMGCKQEEITLENEQVLTFAAYIQGILDDLGIENVANFSERCDEFFQNIAQGLGINLVVPDRAAGQSDSDYITALEDVLTQANVSLPDRNGGTDQEYMDLLIATIVSLDIILSVISGQLPAESPSLFCCLLVLQKICEEFRIRLRNFQLQHLFSEFVQIHPGMEHHAGVLRGGTFVLVYCDFVPAAQQVSFENFLTDIETRGVTTAPDTAYLAQLNSVFGVNLAERTSMVVADFCLPYYCCSDAAGGSARLPEVQTFIPDNFIFIYPCDFCCEDETAYKVGVYPSGGTISIGLGTPVEEYPSPDQDFRFTPSRIKENYGNILFSNEDANSTAVQLFYRHPNNAEPAQITVNLWRMPDNEITAEVSDIDPDTGLVTVTFTNEQASDEGISYKWSIYSVDPDQNCEEGEHIGELLCQGQGESETPNEFTFTAPPGRYRRVRAVLELRNPGCTITGSSRSILWPTQPVMFDDYCCEDATTYTPNLGSQIDGFSASGPNGETLIGAISDPDENGRISFTPTAIKQRLQELFDDPTAAYVVIQLNYLVASQEISTSFKVWNMPLEGITTTTGGTAENPEIIFTSEQPGYDDLTYSWEGQITPEVGEPISILPFSGDGAGFRSWSVPYTADTRSIEVTLNMRNPQCTAAEQLYTERIQGGPEDVTTEEDTGEEDNIEGTETEDSDNSMSDGSGEGNSTTEDVTDETAEDTSSGTATEDSDSSTSEGSEEEDSTTEDVTDETVEDTSSETETEDSDSSTSEGSEEEDSTTEDVTDETVEDSDGTETGDSDSSISDESEEEGSTTEDVIDETGGEEEERTAGLDAPEPTGSPVVESDSVASSGTRGVESTAATSRTTDTGLFEDRQQRYQEIWSELGEDSNMRKYVSYRQTGSFLAMKASAPEEFNPFFQRNGGLILTTLRRKSNVEDEKMTQLFSISLAYFLDQYIAQKTEGISEAVQQVLEKLLTRAKDNGISAAEFLAFWNPTDLKSAAGDYETQIEAYTALITKSL